MDERKEAFNNYISAFKELSIKEKRNELVDSIKELLVIFDELSKQDGIKVDFLHSKKILDLNSDNVSEDDYLEACITYVEIAKDVIGQYLDKKI